MLALLIIVLALQAGTLYCVWPTKPVADPAPILPTDWESLVTSAFADCGLNTHLAHDVLAAVIRRAEMADVHTFADLRTRLEKAARGC